MSQQNSNRFSLCAGALLILVASLSPVTVATAVTRNWNTTNGNWNTPGNWSPPVVPGVSDMVNITFADTTNRTVTYDYTGPAVTLTQLNLDQTGAGASTSTLSMSGNSLTSSIEYVGLSGRGVFNQSGGTNTIPAGANFLNVGGAATATGTYNLSGNGALVATATEYIGDAGTGIFNQTGGTNSVLGNIILANSLGSTGTYTLSGGTLSASNISIGYRGVGTFNQTGGVFSTNGSVEIGLNQGSTGSFNLSGGTTTAGSVSVYTTGTLTVSGTVLNAGALAAFDTSVINFNGGTINTSFLNFFGLPSRFNWTTGTLNLTQNVTWDSAGVPYVTAAAFGSAKTLGSNQTLMITGNETLGGAGGFALTLNSGSTHHVTGTLTVGPLGTITQHFGSNLYAATFTQAGGTVNGTLQNQGNFIYQSGQFNGRLLNQGTVSLGLSFTAGNGVQNETTMTLAAGQVLTVNGAGLSNLGTFTLNGGTISGSGQVVNDFSGTLRGHGTINPTFTNNGVLEVDGVLRFNGAAANNNGIVRGSGSVIGNFVNTAGGTIALTQTDLLAVSGVIDTDGDFNLDWSNAGLVTLADSAMLGGGQIFNSGTIAGAGTVNGPVSNTGVIRAAGGQLNLAANGNFNPAVGQIHTTAGSTVMFLQGLAANAGTLALTGGAFDNNNHALLNTGIINGYGVLRTSALTNANKLNVGEGNMDVLGSVVNNGTIGIQSGRSAYFFGPVSGSGSFTGTGTAVFLAAVSPGSSPASVGFGGNVVFDGASSLMMELGGTSPATQFDQIHVAGLLALGGVLQISLINGFTPVTGNSFDLLDWGSLVGTFASLQLPALGGGLNWNTSALYTSGAISVVAPGIPGDYNNNGVVDGADYVVWRKYNNTATTLPNDATPGTDQSDYNLWRAHFGQTAGSGSGATDSASTSAVPEPCGVILLLSVAMVGVVWRWRSAIRA